MTEDEKILQAEFEKRWKRSPQKDGCLFSGVIVPVSYTHLISRRLLTSFRSVLESRISSPLSSLSLIHILLKLCLCVSQGIFQIIFKLHDKTV